MLICGYRILNVQYKRSKAKNQLYFDVMKSVALILAVHFKGL